MNMTPQEFDDIKFYKGIKAIYKDDFYWVRSVDFEERLLGLVPDFLTMEDAANEDDITWIRCESCRITQ